MALPYRSMVAGWHDNLNPMTMNCLSRLLSCLLLTLPLQVGGQSEPVDVPLVASATVANPSEFARPGEVIRLPLRDFAVDPSDSLAGELIATEDGRQLPTQLSDTDADGVGDTLLVKVDFAAGERKTVNIVRDAQRAAVAGFEKLAHIELSRRTGGKWEGDKYRGGPFQPVSELELPGQLPDHNNYMRYEGPGWESNQIAFRLYLDHRNAIDIFGKLTPAITLPEVGHDGYASYHEPADWGMDILKVGKALGPGGFGQWIDGKAMRVAKTDRTAYRAIENGPLSAAFRLSYSGWQTTGSCNLETTIRIDADSNLSQIHLLSPDAPNALVTGIPKHPEARVYRGETDIPGSGWTWLAMWGKQSLDGSNLGIVIFVKKENFASFGQDKHNELIVLRHRHDGVAYYLGAVWEARSEEAATEEAFLGYVERMQQQLNHPVRVNVQSAVHALAVDRLGAAESAADWTRQFVDSIIAREGLRLAYRPGNGMSWNYTTGLLSFAVYKAGEGLGRPDYSAWSETVIGSFVEDDGTILTYKMEDFNIDKINSGKMLLALWKRTGEERYKLAAEVLLEQLSQHPRTRTGALWHKKIYPWQVWLDGLYMSAPFMAEAAALLERPALLNDLQKIFHTVSPGLRDPETGLYHHAWDEAREQIWADPETGLSKIFWGRGIGWFAMSIVDTLDYLPEDSALAEKLRGMLVELAVALERWQDPESGLWFQVIDQGDRAGNYLEASASSMFVYSLAKGVNRGYLSQRYADVAKVGYEGLVRDFIQQHPDGTLSLGQICEVAGLGFGRDGSWDYYMTEPIVQNDPKGTGPFILAGLEIAELGQPVASTNGWADVDAILEQIHEPVFPDREFRLGDKVKLGDGMDISTVLRQLIKACHEAGGGRVVIPEGTYVTGAIHLLSNVNLHLEEGATLLFKTDPSAYLPVVFTRWEGTELMNYSPLVYAFEAENVAVTGKGVLDGQASVENWWIWKGRKEYGWSEGLPEQTPARDRLRDMAEEGVPVSERVFGEGSYLRPSFIQPYRSRNILIEGVTILRSPMWEIHPVLCENVIVRGVNILSHGPNNDGCNPESSRNVLIEDCTFDTGDDCIAIKSGRNADGRRLATPSENIIVRNCVMKDGHGGVVIGSEISGGCRNVYVENCRMDSPQLDRAIRIKTNSIRGGVVENIFVRNVRIGEVAESVLKVNFLYEEGDTATFTPVVRNIHLENIICEKARMPLYLVGYERSPVEGIELVNCTFGGIEEPSVLRHVKDIRMSGIQQSALPLTDQWGRLLD